MRPPRLVRTVAAVSILVATGVPPAAHAPRLLAATATHPTVPAARFLDTIGVNTHFGYGNTAYGQGDAVQQALLQLGVHHIRDNVPAAPTQVYLSRIAGLGAAGIKVEATVGSAGVPKGGRFIPVSAVLGGLTASSQVTAALDAIEGPNEWDVRGGAGWAAQVRTYQCELYRSVRAEPALSGVTVVAPALSRRTNKPALGNLDNCSDAGNDHLYPRNNPDGDDIALERGRTDSIVVQDKPVIVTETGYTNGLRQTNAKQAVTDEVAAVYIPRLFATSFSAGVSRTFLYEFADEQAEPRLLDQEQHFGLLNSDLTPKPAYTALQRMVALVTDDPAATGQVAGSLNYSISGATDVHDLLLSRTDGTLLLMLWRDVALRPLGNADDAVSEPIRVDFGQAVGQVDVYRPTTSAGAVSTIDSTSAIQGNIAADMVVLRIAPGSGQTLAGTPIAHMSAAVPPVLTGSPPADDVFDTVHLPAAAVPSGPRANPVVLGAGAALTALVAFGGLVAYRRRRAGRRNATGNFDRSMS